MEKIGRKYDKTPAQVLINWTIRHKEVIASSKTMSRDHLDELLGGMGWEMDPEDYEKISEQLSKVYSTK